MNECLVVLLFAFCLDLRFGDPAYRFHPVRIIGRLISESERLLECLGLRSLVGGVLLVIFVQIVVVGAYMALQLYWHFFDILLDIFLVYSCLSLNDLLKHGTRVSAALEMNDLPSARNAVQMLIGRDANTLDEFGVARATVESMAENFIDGLLAPLFWFAAGVIIAKISVLEASAGGVVGILFYKTANTLDSMVGYRNEKYEKFGKAGAKLDDLMNYIPARMGIPILSLSAVFSGLSGRKAWSVGWRDRLKHQSPNSGHAEACVAGALGIQLNGPGIYPHGQVDKPWLGDGARQVTPEHLKLVFRLVERASYVTIALFAGLMVLL